jgi:hypothetical protein
MVPTLIMIHNPCINKLYTIITLNNVHRCTEISINTYVSTKQVAIFMKVKYEIN